MTRATLARLTMGTVAVGSLGVLASSPLTVLNGGITTTYRTTGVTGQPLAFVVVMFVIGLLAVAYVAVGRHVRHGAPFYAQLAQGTNPTLGLAAAGVTFVGYNALHISLYPVLGTTMAGLLGGPWWLWALLGGVAVFLLGQYRGNIAAKVLGIALALELVVMMLFIAAGLTQPAGGAVSFAGFAPSSLLVPGMAASVIVFAVAAYAGIDTVLAFAEEAKTFRALAVGTGGAIAVCGVLYCLASWAYSSWIGLDNLQTAAGQDDSQPLTLLGTVYGPVIADLAMVLLGTSVLAAMSAFAAADARIVFNLSRENVLPAWCGKVSEGSTGGAPLGGATVQAVTAAVVLALFMAAGADPMATIFTWLSTIGAVCVLVLLTAANWSALTFFERGLGGTESVWIRQVFPFTGGIIGIFVVLFMVSSLSNLLGTPPGSATPWLVAAPIITAIIIATVTGLVLRRTRPDVYAQIGRGVPDGRTVQDHVLEGVEV
ncbi:APC family permease [Actinoplanes sp. GCM10030250]|uniref:APC family permease n=1 Tax=Actinoplanes sp. GCM10030250 TaxID=3273376 RepID=UPI00361695A4